MRAARRRGPLVDRVLCAVVLAGMSACAVQNASRNEPGLGEAPPVSESVTFAPSAEDAPGDCRSRFAPDDLAGFVQELFGAVIALQLSVDANPIRQFLNDPEGVHLAELSRNQECSARVLASFRESPDRRMAELARAMSALLADAAQTERASSQKFRSTDWTALGSDDAQARRWAEIRPSTASLSARGAELVERIVPLLREDGRATDGPGRLRITREDRDVALRHRGRLTDLTIMVEKGIDAGGALSISARKVLKWLHHAHGLTFR